MKKGNDNIRLDCLERPSSKRKKIQRVINYTIIQKEKATEVFNHY